MVTSVQIKILNKDANIKCQIGTDESEQQQAIDQQDVSETDAEPSAGAHSQTHRSKLRCPSV